MSKSVDAIEELLQDNTTDMPRAVCLNSLTISGDDQQQIFGFTPEEIRTAAKSFKVKTSIGTDNWSFRKLLLMPGTVLQPLGVLLATIRHMAAPPLQMLLNMLAILPKKTGDTRTVAIASTIYRLLMQLDHAPMDGYKSKNAFIIDSAKKGASAVTSAEDRASMAELAHLSGMRTYTLLWDISKFFDSIQLPSLIAEAKATHFPVHQLALSLTVHSAPRRLRFRKGLGPAMLGFGTSILAGCNRSTGLARAYTIRLVRRLADQYPAVPIFQHVDDISNIVRTHTETEALQQVLGYARSFAIGMKQLRMTISPKSMIVPCTPVSRAAARFLSKDGIHIATAKSGIDLGVETSAARHRVNAKQSSRVSAAKKRAGRIAFLSKKHSKARRLAVTRAAPTQDYAASVQGAPPSTIARMRSNIALATGDRSSGPA